MDHSQGPKLTAREIRKAAVVETSGFSPTQMSPLVALPPRPSTDQFYPILYGTGIRSVGNSVFVAIQGLKAPVGCGNPQGAIAGLDQTECTGVFGARWKWNGQNRAYRRRNLPLAPFSSFFPRLAGLAYRDASTFGVERYPTI